MLREVGGGKGGGVGKGASMAGQGWRGFLCNDQSTMGLDLEPGADRSRGRGVAEGAGWGWGGRGRMQADGAALGLWCCLVAQGLFEYTLHTRSWSIVDCGLRHACMHAWAGACRGFSSACMYRSVAGCLVCAGRGKGRRSEALGLLSLLSLWQLLSLRAFYLF